MKVQAFATEFDLMPLDEAVNTIIAWSDQKTHCRYVVTPNVDHIITLRENAFFRQAYKDADLRLIDGWPVAKAIGLIFGLPTSTVPGSDLVPAIFDELNIREQASSVYLLGALPGVADLAAKTIADRWPNVVVAGTYSPPFGFQNDQQECSKICAMLRKANPNILVIGVGAPKQELWIHRYRDQIAPCTVICAGATIDFLSGTKKRAPMWVRRLRLEWVYRVSQEPKRLFMRYAKGLLLFPACVLREKFLQEFKR
jgi:N-acetylglucosaminyldiphosphoundecaprenol N-acetyl-beta-D-mannosaminyltransferase